MLVSFQPTSTTHVRGGDVVLAGTSMCLLFKDMLGDRKPRLFGLVVLTFGLHGLVRMDGNPFKATGTPF